LASTKLNAAYSLKNKNTKIAVLIGGHTASSGEMTAVSFIGKQNAKLFGQESEGYLTINNTLPLSNGAMLNLATGYIADRNKMLHQYKLTPDVVITADAANSNDDATLDAAKKWLLK
jgi:carboxyl-terminal processing protease